MTAAPFLVLKKPVSGSLPLDGVCASTEDRKVLSVVAESVVRLFPWRGANRESFAPAAAAGMTTRNEATIAQTPGTNHRFNRFTCTSRLERARCVKGTGIFARNLGLVKDADRIERERAPARRDYAPP